MTNPITAVFSLVKSFGSIGHTYTVFFFLVQRLLDLNDSTAELD